MITSPIEPMVGARVSPPLKPLARYFAVISVVESNNKRHELQITAIRTGNHFTAMEFNRDWVVHRTLVCWRLLKVLCGAHTKLRLPHRTSDDWPAHLLLPSERYRQICTYIRHPFSVFNLIYDPISSRCEILNPS